MPDISKCEGTNCPLKEKCHRFTVPSGERQSFFTEPPYGKPNDKDQECEYFWFNGNEPRPINRKTSLPIISAKLGVAALDKLDLDLVLVDMISREEEESE